MKKEHRSKKRKKSKPGTDERGRRGGQGGHWQERSLTNGPTRIYGSEKTHGPGEEEKQKKKI